MTANARAANKEASKQAQERSARKACLSGEYNKGVTILSELFVDTKNPTHIFNQGRCFEQNHQYEDAVSRFEEYLRVPDANLSAADRAVAEKHITDCKARLPDQSGKSQASAPQLFVPPPPLPTPVAPPDPPASPETSPETLTSSAAKPDQRPGLTQSGLGLRVTGIVAMSVGAAAVATGVFLNLKANTLSNNMATTVGNYEARSGDRKNYETLAWVGYGVGAACVVTGAILYGIGRRTGGDSSSSVALLPAIGIGHAGAILAGAF